MLTTSLEFNISLFLGVSATERKTIQTVSISFTLLYKKMPEAARITNTNDYICYQDISSKLHAEFSNKEIKLLEHLAYQIYLCIKKITGESAAVNVRVRKTCPYIASDSLSTAQCEYKEF